MGDLPWLWENGRPVGICQNVWGNSSGVWLYGGTAIPYGRMACVEGRRIAWGNRDTIWGDGLCGGPLNRMGSRENVWGSGAHGDLRGVGYSVWPARCGIADFVVFCELPEGG